MSRKIIALLLVLCLALSLAACSSGGSSEQSSQSQESSQTQEPSQSSEPSTAESTETPTQPDEGIDEKEPTGDLDDNVDVVQPANAEPIEFEVNRLHTDENGAILGTATVSTDGYYLFSTRTAPMSEDAEVTLTTDLPISMDTATVPAEAFTNGYDLCAIMELTAGDYTMAVGNALYSSSLIPVQMVDSPAGAFAQGGVYVCRLEEPVTVTFSENDKAVVQFYGGGENTFLQMLEPTEASTIEFPAGIAVINTIYYYDTLTATES